MKAKKVDVDVIDDEDDVDDNDDIRIDCQSDNKTTTLHVHHGFCFFIIFFLHFFAVKCLSSRFMKDANKRPRIFLSLSKLECGPREITFKEIRLHWTFSANWNKRTKVRKNANSF